MAIQEPQLKRKTLQTVVVDDIDFVVSNGTHAHPTVASVAFKAKTSGTSTVGYTEAQTRKTTTTVYTSQGGARLEMGVGWRVKTYATNSQHGKAQKMPVHTAGLFVACPECAAKVRYNRLDNRLRRVHSKSPTTCTPRQQQQRAPRELVSCPTHHATVQKDKLAVHMRKVHGVLTMRDRRASLETRSTTPRTWLDRASDVLLDEHEQDGGRYLGFMARENCKFGSLPLYDDYSDGAWPSNDLAKQ